MGLFYKNNGAISVFLCLILLPVLLFAGMTTDAARIYMAKVVISDAGDLAMNAGLAQYNEELHDEYGLLVMDQTPEAMSGDLEKYFVDSLNASNLPDQEDYQQILDLLSQRFEALSVAGTEIYRTEVEKQQILEYMKYRAPVCLTELVLEKIDQLRDTKKMTEAMEAEMEFVEDMEDCQDAFEEALEALDKLNGAVSRLPGVSSIQQALDRAKMEYETILSKCLLMRAMIQRYRSYDKTMDLESAAQSFINMAKRVDLSDPCSEDTFDSYIDCLYYKNTVDHLGGIEKLKDRSDAEEDETSDADESQEAKDLESIVQNYKAETARLEGDNGYAYTLQKTALEVVRSHFTELSGYRTVCQEVEDAADDAYEKLKDVKKKLETAGKSFTDWDEKTNALKEIGKDGGMAQETDEYRDFFNNGEGGENLELLENLMEKVSSNKEYAKSLSDNLQKERFHEQSLASQEPKTQMNEYRKKADQAVSGKTAGYMSEEDVRRTYMSEYEHIELQIGNSLQSIADDPFYQRLQEYCKEREEQDSQQQQDDANKNLEAGNQAASEAGEVDDSYPVYNWAEAPGPLPSALLDAAGGPEAEEGLTGMDAAADVDNSGSRRDTISDTKESMGAASEFLAKVDEIVTGGLENLYIAEYAMQMFSYYTVDKEDGQPRQESDIISISGYPLTGHAAYRGECEYILWGDSSSQNNVRNTIMMIFGIRMLFNSFFALTNTAISSFAYSAASVIAGAAPYLIPIVKVVIQLGLAGVETADDMNKMKQGFGVTILKDPSTWRTYPTNHVKFGDNTSGVTLDYAEYLRIFLNLSILIGNEQQTLARIADCIQVNTDVPLSESFTMLSVNADIKARTTFMRKISDWGENGLWRFPDDNYTIHYESILGY